MSIKLNEQFQKLKDIVLSAERFVYYVGGDPYEGPINPTAIYVSTHDHHHIVRFVFVLADRVSAQDLGEGWEESLGGFMSTELNGNFEFEDWDPVTKTLKVDGEDSPDGTLWGRCEDVARNPNTHFSMALLFIEQEEQGHTGLLMQKR